MLGVFGSAFNPPTKGHAFVIHRALGLFDRVIAVPSYHHNFGKLMAPFEVRMDLAEALVQDLNQPRVCVSGIEKEIWTGQPVTSLALLRALSEQYPEEEPVLIVGPDNGKRLHEFADYDTLSREFPIYVVNERDNRFPRSTEVRRRINALECFDDAVTPSVGNLLRNHGAHFFESFVGL